MISTILLYLIWGYFVCNFGWGIYKERKDRKSQEIIWKLRDEIIELKWKLDDSVLTDGQVAFSEKLVLARLRGAAETIRRKADRPGECNRTVFIMHNIADDLERPGYFPQIAREIRAEEVEAHEAEGTLS